MARGWESKSVEAQIDMAELERHRVHQAKEPADLDLVRKKESLTLSRTRVKRELDATENPRYKELLNKALTELNAQLAKF